MYLKKSAINRKLCTIQLELKDQSVYTLYIRSHKQFNNIYRTEWYYHGIISIRITKTLALLQKMYAFRYVKLRINKNNHARQRYNF